MSQRYWCVLLVPLLTGCATTPTVADGTERAVVVDVGTMDFGGGESKALTVADQHCAQHGRKAQFRGRLAPMLLAFDCVQ